MHFDTPNEALAFIKKHSIEGDIIKDPYQQRVIHVSSKMMGENFGEVITYIYGMIGDSNEKMLAASRVLKVNANTLVKFMKDPYEVAPSKRDKIVENLPKVEQAVKSIG